MGLCIGGAVSMVVRLAGMAVQHANAVDFGDDCCCALGIERVGEAPGKPIIIKPA
jgi:hypothetical protein